MGAQVIDISSFRERKERRELEDYRKHMSDDMFRIPLDENEVLEEMKERDSGGK